MKCSLAFSIEQQPRVKRLLLGTRLFLGLGNLAVHKKINRTIDYASFVDKSYVSVFEIEKRDRWRPVPAPLAGLPAKTEYRL
jgi:hypothetical protein